MRFDVVTIFPQTVMTYVSCGVLGRALTKKIVSVHTWNPRDYTDDKHGKVDDRIYGGGSGMLMMAPCVGRAIHVAKQQQPLSSLAIYLSPQGRLLDQAAVNRFAKEYDGLVLLAGRYKGVDERIMHDVDEEWSMGDYVLSGGEPAAIALIDAVSRQIDGVVGDSSSVQSDSFMDGLLDTGHYTRPAQHKGNEVPPVLLQGDHEAIRKWRLKQSLGRTLLKRPNLLLDKNLSREECLLLREFVDECCHATDNKS